MKTWGIFSKVLFLTFLFSGMTFLGNYSSEAAYAESRLGSGHWRIKALDGVENVSWDMGAGLGVVVLSRNGEEVARSSGAGTFQIAGVEPSSTDEFVLSVTTELDDSRTAQLARKWSEPQAYVKALVKHVSTGTLSITMPSLNGPGSSAEAANALPASTLFRYTTFIADAVMPDPPAACTDTANPLLQRFVGDNRQPNPDATRFRTRIDVNIDWTSFSAFSVSKSIGPTRREQFEFLFSPYPHFEWTLNKLDYADSSTMSVARIGSPGWDYLSFSITQDVRDPLCNPATVNGIYFDYKVTISRTGGYQMDGESVIFPTHEVYFQNSNDHIWHTIMVLPTQNWFCLVPGPTSGALGCKQPHSTFGVY
jgi:hypothetical protein